MCPSPVHPDKTRGYLMPIGGAEDKGRNPRILSRFVEICGGEKARLMIIPTASQLPTFLTTALTQSRERGY